MKFRQYVVMGLANSRDDHPLETEEESLPLLSLSVTLCSFSKFSPDVCNPTGNSARRITRMLTLRIQDLILQLRRIPFEYLFSTLISLLSIMILHQMRDGLATNFLLWLNLPRISFDTLVRVIGLCVMAYGDNISKVVLLLKERQKPDLCG
jgi:hypothetical protein